MKLSLHESTFDPEPPSRKPEQSSQKAKSTLIVKKLGNLVKPV